MYKIKRMMASYPAIQLETGAAAKLRGFFASHDAQDVLLHQHEDQRFCYRYPLVQYKVLRNVPYVIALNEGISSIYPILMEDAPLRIGSREYSTESLSIRVDSVMIGDCREMVTYRFVTPWLCLNQENYRLYQKSSDEEKKVLLEKILIGNILSFTKSMGIQVKGQLIAETDLKEISLNFKNERMKGFVGQFKVNYIIPDLLGIGKSVSRGFGTIRHLKQKGEHEDELV